MCENKLNKWKWITIFNLNMFEFGVVFGSCYHCKFSNAKMKSHFFGVTIQNELFEVTNFKFYFRENNVCDRQVSKVDMRFENC